MVIWVICFIACYLGGIYGLSLLINESGVVFFGPVAGPELVLSMPLGTGVQLGDFVCWVVLGAMVVLLCWVERERRKTG